jgi:hypothetical protein
MNALNLNWNAGWCNSGGNPDKLDDADWRQPTKAELEAIVSGPGGIDGFLSDGMFTNVTHDVIWTSTVHTQGVCSEEDFGGDCFAGWTVQPLQWAFHLSTGTFTVENADTYGSIWLWAVR